MSEDFAVHGLNLESAVSEVLLMRGRAIFLAFFVVFSAASYAVPVPLFPGNVVPSWFTVPTGYAQLIGALVNGIVYGSVVWLVFVLVSRKFEEPQATKAKGKKLRNNKRRSITR